MQIQTAQAIFDHAFGPSRDRRSEAYKQGVLSALRVRVDGAEFVPCPYTAGSAEFDAYFAGICEGRALSPVDGNLSA